MPAAIEENEYKSPKVMVDIVLMTIVDEKLHIALWERDRAPDIGQKALIGGFIHSDEKDEVDEDTEATAARVLWEKAGLKGLYVEQLRTFSGLKRDSERGWTVSVAYMALVPAAKIEIANNPAISLHCVDDLGDLPFDHNEIVEYALYRLRGKGAYSTLPLHLLADEFTLKEMIEVYEQVIGTEIDKSSFRRKVADLDLIEETGGMMTGSHRPTKMYQMKSRITTFDRKL